MPFERLTESFYDHQITLPITLPDGRETEYTVPSPDSETGQTVQRIALLAAQISEGKPVSDDDQAFLNDMPDMDSDQVVDMVLTAELHAQLRADKVPWQMYRHIVGCVMTWVAYGRDAAEEYWNQKPAEEAPKKPTPADHKPPAKKAASRASSATKTSRRSSGNPAKRAATAGSKSTTTGRSSKRTSTSSTG